MRRFMHTGGVPPPRRRTGDKNAAYQGDGSLTGTTEDTEQRKRRFAHSVMDGPAQLRHRGSTITCAQSVEQVTHVVKDGRAMVAHEIHHRRLRT
jgi:hypothetical protein